MKAPSNAALIALTVALAVVSSAAADTVGPFTNNNGNVVNCFGSVPREVQVIWSGVTSAPGGTATSAYKCVLAGVKPYPFNNVITQQCNPQLSNLVWNAEGANTVVTFSGGFTGGCFNGKVVGSTSPYSQYVCPAVTCTCTSNCAGGSVDPPPVESAPPALELMTNTFTTKQNAPSADLKTCRSLAKYTVSNNAETTVDIKCTDSNACAAANLYLDNDNAASSFATQNNPAKLVFTLKKNKGTINKDIEEGTGSLGDNIGICKNSAGSDHFSCCNAGARGKEWDNVNNLCVPAITCCIVGAAGC
ncbi:hypothetical protein FOA52_000846 [Chlamydomonas sp. UWO 241]|nr:hypothetical protein FOA52_000846 [Chlamydomonas sp. UWO 241]